MTEPITVTPDRRTRPRPPIEPDAPVYNASLVRRVDETESLAYFWVRFDGEPTPFEAGQYMTIGVMAGEKMLQRPYSVASPPAVAGHRGLRVLRPARPGRDVHAAPVRPAGRATGCG